MRNKKFPSERVDTFSERMQLMVRAQCKPETHMGKVEILDIALIFRGRVEIPEEDDEF